MHRPWAYNTYSTVLYSGYGKLNPRAALRVLNKKYIKVRINNYHAHIEGAAKPRATQQVQHVLCHTSGHGEAARCAAATE